MNLPEVKPEETLQDYIKRALEEGLPQSAIPALAANFNKK